MDILSGCYWTDGKKGGHIQMLAGNGKLNFEEAVSIKDVDGDPLQNEVVADDEGTMPANQTSTICTQQHAVDYDGDGDLDLVVGCFGESFYLYENQAQSPSDPPELLKPVKFPIQSTGYHSAPHFADWDGDGDLDLLSGHSDGGVIISENTGTKSEPVWSEFKQLLPPSSAAEQMASEGEDIQMSASTRIWTVDWNGDGLLDLLVGDSASIVSLKDGITKAEYEKRNAEAQVKMAELAEEREVLYPKFEKLMEEGKEPDEELQAQMKALSKRMRKIYDARKEYSTTKATGFVWLLIRKADKTPSKPKEISMKSTN